MSRLAAAALAVATAVAVPTAADAAPKSNSATLGVAKLAWPAVGVEYERRLARKFGAGAYAGLGQFNPISLRAADGNNLASEDFSFREAGLRGNLYAIGGFKHGMVLGVTAQFRSYQFSTSSGNSSASVMTTIIGPHIGYKLILKKGFTLGFLGGIGMFKSGDVNVEAGGESETVSDPFADIPIMAFGTVNAGWSF